MTNSNTILTFTVIAFAAFIVAGLAIVPSLNINYALAETKKLNDNTDSDKNNPILELLKNGKSKKPKKNT